MEWLTIFTPTYNREMLLRRVFEKLNNQTEKGFIWLIIDDGSIDNTKRVVEDFKNKASFKIEYVYQENAGKQRAVNTGLDHCKTDWFAFCDSDDWYLPDTVQEMQIRCKKLENESKICGIVARRGNQNKECKVFPKIKCEEMVINLPVLYEKYGFHAETCAVFKTNALRYARYPEISDKFIPESFMFDKYSQKYDVLFVNKVWSITEYLSDGLTIQSTKLYHNNPYGVYYALKEATNTNYGFVKNIKNEISLRLWISVHGIQDKHKRRLNPIVEFGVLFARITKKPNWIWGNGK